MNPTYSTVQDIQIDEDIDYLQNLLWVKLILALFMDALGLIVMFTVCDLQFTWMFGLFFNWNPFNYLIQIGYPIRALYGGLLYFSIICLGHLIFGIISTIKYKDRLDSYIIRILKKYKFRVQQSKFKKK